jgi:hypothetical protein
MEVNPNLKRLENSECDIDISLNGIILFDSLHFLSSTYFLKIFIFMKAG